MRSLIYGYLKSYTLAFLVLVIFVNRLSAALGLSPAIILEFQMGFRPFPLHNDEQRGRFRTARAQRQQLRCLSIESYRKHVKQGQGGQPSQTKKKREVPDLGQTTVWCTNCKRRNNIKDVCWYENDH